MFYGSQIFRFVGVLVSWLFVNVYKLIIRQNTVSFKYLWKGPNYDDAADGAAHEMKYIFLGFVILMLICWIIIKLGF
jgi:hypothetical protein